MWRERRLKNILVTGATGFVGTHLINKLKRKNNVVGLVHKGLMGKWQRSALAGSTRCYGDVRDFLNLRNIMARFEIDEVYHTAALAKVKTAYRDPVSVYDVNVMGTVAVLEAARSLDIENVLVLNTDKVYGEGLDLDEDIAYEHSEPYATSKCCQGFIVKSYIDTYGMRIVMPHACNIFGYDPFSNRIVPNVVKACLTGKSPKIYTNDSSIREYVFVEDLLNGLVRLMEDFALVGPFNFATGWVYNQKELVLKILEHFPDLEAEYVEVPLPPQIESESLSTCKWDWKPEWDLDTAIGVTIEQFESYRGDWIRE